MALSRMRPTEAHLALVPPPAGSARLLPYRKLTVKEKMAYLDSFSLNASNALLAQLRPDDELSVAASEALAAPYDPTSSLTAQYRLMQDKNRTRLRLKILRSPIQGWGVFAQQPIARGEVRLLFTSSLTAFLPSHCSQMIIEYVGELINPSFADAREARYNSMGIGCYMFRVPDEDEIIDATMTGNMARFINHSCDPNAKTDWITIGSAKKIIIFAIKDIAAGTEISYDYQFEADEELVTCSCGARNCQGYMNR